MECFLYHRKVIYFHTLMQQGFSYDIKSPEKLILKAYTTRILSQNVVIFSHPDYTVGFGFSPISCRYGSRTCPHCGITVGREFFSKKSPCPEEHLYFIFIDYIVLIYYYSVNYSMIIPSKKLFPLRPLSLFRCLYPL